MNRIILSLAAVALSATTALAGGLVESATDDCGPNAVRNDDGNCVSVIIPVPARLGSLGNAGTIAAVAGVIGVAALVAGSNDNDSGSH